MVQVYQEREGDVHLIDVYVHWLREKLEDDHTHPQLIQTNRQGRRLSLQRHLR
jgi:DNA-binding response OmpR family regulator